MTRRPAIERAYRIEGNAESTYDETRRATIQVMRRCRHDRPAMWQVLEMIGLDETARHLLRERHDQTSY
jgi:hypothetical protein